MANVFEYCINSTGQVENIIFTDLTLNGTNTKVYTAEELNKIMLTRHGEKSCASTLIGLLILIKMIANVGNTG